jgi:4-carboxymuconolactone decarboxylase
MFTSCYTLYAYTIVAKKATINDGSIGVLASGQQPVGLSKEEMLAHAFTQQFTTMHHISSDLYQQALETFEEQGVVDMLVLAGHYMTVSAVLNAFAVPAPVS